MSAGLLASVVIRAKNEAAHIGRTLELLARQTAADRLEVIVVDSGSTDGTTDIARAHGARVVEIPPASFTFGYALNRGCAEAGADLIVALSAHAFPPDEEWAGRMLEPFADERVAATSGINYAPDGTPLLERCVQDAEHARRHPLWGHGNTSGAFRAELWREHPFREDMPFTEDKEWGWHWMQRGYVVVIDPSFAAQHDHAHRGLREIYSRSRREWIGFRMYLDVEPYGVRDLVREWWTDQGGHSSQTRARLSYRRAAKLAGAYRGRRAKVASATSRSRSQ